MRNSAFPGEERVRISSPPSRMVNSTFWGAALEDRRSQMYRVNRGGSRWLIHTGRRHTVRIALGSIQAPHPRTCTHILCLKFVFRSSDHVAIKPGNMVIGSWKLASSIVTSSSASINCANTGNWIMSLRRGWYNHCDGRIVLRYDVYRSLRMAVRFVTTTSCAARIRACRWFWICGSRMGWRRFHTARICSVRILRKKPSTRTPFC